MKTILLVEDDRNLADGLVLNLEAEGYQVVTVSDGNLVLDSFRKGVFDLILLDIMLPGVDGLSLCKQIRKEGSTIPIRHVTGPMTRSRDYSPAGMTISPSRSM